MKNVKLDNTNNILAENKIIRKKDEYFSKRHPDEESLYKIDIDTQDLYEKIENIYNKIVSLEKLELARVNSLEEREKLNLRKDDNFVYGEMTFRTMAYIKEIIKHSFGPHSIKEGDFFDLGSVNLF